LLLTVSFPVVEIEKELYDAGTRNERQKRYFGLWTDLDVRKPDGSELKLWVINIYYFIVDSGDFTFTFCQLK